MSEFGTIQHKLRGAAKHPHMDNTCKISVFDANEAADELDRLKKDRDVAIRWANQSVEMLQDAFFPVADALRALEAYLRHTPHHNAPEAAAARKALNAFDDGTARAREVVEQTSLPQSHVTSEDGR